MRDFEERLKTIRNSQWQTKQIKLWSGWRWKALAWAVTAGLSLSISALVWLSLGRASGLFFVGAAFIAFVFADSAILKVSDLSKEQDRQYFIECLKAAENEVELSAAGLDAGDDGSDAMFQ